MQVSHWRGRSEVRIILAASPDSEPKPHQINKLLCPFDSEVSKDMPHSEANFGIGTLGCSGNMPQKPKQRRQNGSFAQR